jgi:hypothetical protein
VPAETVELNAVTHIPIENHDNGNEVQSNLDSGTADVRALVAHEESTGAKSGDGLGPEILDFLNTAKKKHGVL